ncbi:HU family DNA-binding protein [Wolbachia endosymbiont of Ctenocephalides felis wCfeJ]|uniref:HU family DNA-binding protein n=1 Tax=Wolbachia endosymbiont of Ctenocephalides felis wCfeJ TaxID=2732594 RepID=UPI0014479C63|nr:HU family DNA-binding protein [Wolbachia endosymbiont of Ctenocephalides felis wCfeJ]WCR57986.1 MAG: Integration host factor subunit beta [Wolbachia endosymbiont of Ctenocephalides felis wCfeJ]
MATKSDIIAKVAKRHPSLDKVVVEAIVNRFFEVLSGALGRHNRIEIRGFGAFSIRYYKLKTVSHLMLQNFEKDQYFKTYFRGSKKLSELLNG